MQMEFNDLGGCRRELKVEYSAEEVRGKYAELLKDYVKYGRVNGFRPGHAPEAMIRRQYGKQIAQDIHDRLFGEGYRAALAKYEFIHIADIEFHDATVADGQPFAFSLVMEIAPEPDVSACPYKGIPLDAAKIEIGDDRVTEAIEHHLRDRGTFQDAAEGEAAADGDIVSFDFTATMDGRPLGEVLGTDDSAAKALAQGQGQFARAGDTPSIIPGLGPRLVGLAPGGTCEFDVPFPDDFRVEALRGKTATYSVKVNKIRRLVPRAMDEAFFKEAGVADEAELRAKIRTILEDQAKDAEADRLETALRDALLEKVSFDLPSKEVEQTQNRIVYQIAEQNLRRGIPESAIRDGFEQINATAAKEAERALRIKYLFRAIAKAEKISVSNHELRALLASQGSDPDETVKRMARESKTDEDSVRAEIRSNILRSKVENFLLGNALWSGDGADSMRHFLGLDSDTADDGSGKAGA